MIRNARVRIIITDGNGAGQARAAMLNAMEKLNCQRRGVGSSKLEYEICIAGEGVQRGVFEQIFGRIKEYTR